LSEPLDPMERARFQKGEAFCRQDRRHAPKPTPQCLDATVAFSTNTTTNQIATRTENGHRDHEQNASPHHHCAQPSKVCFRAHRHRETSASRDSALDRGPQWIHAAETLEPRQIAVVRAHLTMKLDGMRRNLKVRREVASRSESPEKAKGELEMPAPRELSRCSRRATRDTGRPRRPPMLKPVSARGPPRSPSTRRARSSSRSRQRQSGGHCGRTTRIRPACGWARTPGSP